MKMKGTRVLSDLLKCSQRIRVLEGSSRSSKTISIIQWIILYCQTAASRKEIKQVTISRQKLTWLKATVLPDFIQVLREYELFNENDFHRSEMVYHLFGCDISFIGLDEPQKLHGRKQHIFWINEAIEATFDDFTQLLMRTEEAAILDYNPSATEHWIYDKVLSRPDSEFIHSTFRDNPFVSEAIKDEIRGYEPTPDNIRRGTADEIKWKIYGLGERAQIEGLVITNVGYVNEFPVVNKRGIGLDFGFVNDPTAITRVGMANGELYVKELCYKKGMTNADIDLQLKLSGVSKSELIVADSAEMKSIEEIRRMGWNITPCKKGAGSVNIGLDLLKRYRINVTDDSLNLRKELQNYTWRKDRATNAFMNIPVDSWNHCIDSMRYVCSELFQHQFSRQRPMNLSQHWTKAL